ncbi:TolC family protein [bacterium]|nr:TolC family protein [bacterium]
MSAVAMAMSLAGCSVELPTIDDRLKPIAKPLLVDGADQGGEPILKTSQPEPYASIIRQNYGEVRFRFDDNLRTLEIDRLRVRQSRLPQITPGLSTSVRSVASVDLNIRQVLFNGDLSKAMFQDADMQAVNRQIDLLESLNDDVLEDILTYLSYRENTERSRLLSNLARRLEDLLSVAETRLQGGIGTADEVTLFQLELTEVETEALIAKSDAAVDLSTLENINARIPPRPFVENNSLLPIEILSALAGRDQARVDLAVAKEESEPRLVLAANTGINSMTGVLSNNAGLIVEADPLQFGGDADILSAEQAVFLAERELDDTVLDVEKETRRLLQQISALQTQERQTSVLVDQTQLRLDAFQEQFLAGSSGLSEAAGLVDTLRRSLEQKVDVRYRILSLQSELAANLGHFWEF